MSRRERIDLIRETVKTRQGRNLHTPLKRYGLITWDEMQKIVSELPRRPVPDWMKPIVEEWAKEMETPEWKARFAEIEATWRTYEKNP